MCRAKQTKFEPLDARVPKTVKKPKKRNLARNFKQMTVLFDYNQFNTITYTIRYCVPRFVPNKQILNHFMRE